MLTSATRRIVNASGIENFRGQKAERTEIVLRGGRCRRCPFCAPTGECLDPAIKSGRCGDWVWYLRGSKQCRRGWTRPRDPRAPGQLYWRARLSAASRKYSQSLTDKQHEACIAAGAKLHSRPRLAQSGPLTGQQYWVRKECAAKAEGSVPHAEGPANGRQTEGISRSTWEPHRGLAGASPGHDRRHTGDARNSEGRRENEECRTTGTGSGAGQVRSAESEVRGANGRRCGEGVPSRPRRMRARSTWERYRSGSLSGPCQCRRGEGWGRQKEEWRRENGSGAGWRWSGHWRELWHGS